MFLFRLFSKCKSSLEAAVNDGLRKLPLLLKEIPRPFLTAASMAAGATLFPIAKEMITFTGVDVTVLNSLPSKIKQSKVATVHYDGIKQRNLYVERPSLLKHITDIIDRKDGNGKYVVMYGAKGTGKSTAAEGAVAGKEGVLMLNITTASSRDDVMRQLAKVLNVVELNPDTKDFVAALRRGKSNEGIIPTILIEVERAGSLDQSLGVHAARGIAKELSAAYSVRGQRCAGVR